MTLQQPIRAILFDFDGTLRHSDPDGGEVFRAFAQEMGLEIDEALHLNSARWMHYYFARSEAYLEDREQADGDLNRFWQLHTRRHLRFLGAPEETLEHMTAEIMGRMEGEYQPEDVVEEDALPTIEQLRQQGFIVGVISNRREPFTDLLKDLGFDGVFEITLAAGEIEAWKPDPQVFQHALDRLEMDPGDAVYIGDNYYADVVGAEAAGMQAVLIDPKGIFSGAHGNVIQTLEELISLTTGEVLQGSSDGQAGQGGQAGTSDDRPLP